MLHLGIDFGFDQVKIAAVEHGLFGARLSSTSQMPIPPKSITKNGLEPASALVTAARLALQKSNLHFGRHQRVTSAIPASLVLTKRLELPAMPHHELANSISFEAGQSFPIPIDELIIDWLIIPNAQSKKINQTVVLLVGAPRALVTGLVGLFDQLGLQLLGLEIKPLANARAVTAVGDTSCFLLVDIGAVESSIAVVDHGVVIHVTSLDFGASQLQDSKSHALKILPAIPPDLLPPREGQTKATNQNKKRKGSPLKDTVKSLALEIMSLLKYSAQHLALGAFKEIRLCGGNSQIEGLATTLADLTGIPTTLANPLARLTPDKNQGAKQLLPFTTAIGLALRKDF